MCASLCACPKGSDHDGCAHVRLVTSGSCSGSVPFKLLASTHIHSRTCWQICSRVLISARPDNSDHSCYCALQRRRKKRTTTLFTETTFVLLLSIVKENSSAISPPQRTLVCYVEVGVVSVVQGSINLKTIFLKVAVNASGCLTLRDFLFYAELGVDKTGILTWNAGASLWMYVQAHYSALLS